MTDLKSPAVVKSLMKKYKVAANKQFGQNFLFDANALINIAEAAEIENSTVLEIGPGMGALTQELAMRAEKVVAVEIDRGFLAILEETLADFMNVKVIHGDFLKEDPNRLHEQLGMGTFSVCANLPYYISTPVMMSLLESGLPIERMVFLMQKEVADRIMAKPGQKNYGSLSIAAQYYADIEMIAKVSPSCFMPAPNVDSVVLRLNLRPPAVNVKDESMFFKLIRISFAMRRKTLANNLSAGLSFCDKAKAQKILTENGFSPDIRAEMLSIDDFALLSDALTLASKEA